MTIHATPEFGRYPCCDQPTRDGDLVTPFGPRVTCDYAREVDEDRAEHVRRDERA